ncbi:MAG: hypothetical protein C5B50_21335 [Verrucomicrobia bacterium]|nr:MAG: hypothetical protein C5B50_21335 [Verrucomicrobiota bacterium]
MFCCVKSASVLQVPKQWPEILRWLAAGEEVELTEESKVIAKVVPSKQASPDFLRRAENIWGKDPQGKPLSELVAEGRGSKP